MDADNLCKIPFFSTLTLDQLESVAGVCAELEIEAGATLLREGDFGYAMFAITSGTASVVQGDHVLRTLGPGDVFGEIAVFSGGRRSASVVATSPMQLVTVLNRDMWRLERDVPDVAAAIRATIAERLEPSSSSPPASSV